MFLPFFGAVFWSPILAKELIKLGIQAIGESTQWLLCANITCLSFWSVLPSAQMRLGLKMDEKKNIKKNRRLPPKMPIIEWEKWYTINFWGIFRQSQESMGKTLGLDGDSRPNKGWSTEQMTQRRGTDAVQDMYIGGGASIA